MEPNSLRLSVYVLCIEVALELTHRPEAKLRDRSFATFRQSPRLTRPETRGLSALDQLVTRRT